MNLKELGIEPSELVEKIVEKAVERLLEGYTDEDTGDWVAPGIEKRITKQIEEITNARVSEFANEHIKPRIADTIEKITFQKTNEWGDKKSEALTFREYLIQRAEKWMVEEVDFDGKSREENTWGSWKKAGTRVAFMIDKHLQYHIENSVKTALLNANQKIATGLADAVKIKLHEAANEIKVSVKTR